MSKWSMPVSNAVHILSEHTILFKCNANFNRGGVKNSMQYIQHRYTSRCISCECIL